ASASSWAGRGAARARFASPSPTGPGLRHCSSGEMLREEVASGSPLARTIERIAKEGGLVPSSTVLALLKKQLGRMPGSLIALDGFPRSVQNMTDFEEVLGSPELAVVVDVPDDIMVERIMHRAITSGRADDNPEAARRRVKTFHEETAPTIDSLTNSGVPVYRLDGTRSKEEIWSELLEKCPTIGNRVPKSSHINAP
ncbi:hypothetical protein ACHAWF_011747, partial [Thalassiosira exigua]